MDLRETKGGAYGKVWREERHKLSSSPNIKVVVKIIKSFKKSLSDHKGRPSQASLCSYPSELTSGSMLVL